MLYVFLIKIFNATLLLWVNPNENTEIPNRKKYFKCFIKMFSGTSIVIFSEYILWKT